MWTGETVVIILEAFMGALFLLWLFLFRKKHRREGDRRNV